MSDDRVREWRWRWIGGVKDTLGEWASKAVGFRTPLTTEYDADTNPQGWRRDQLATCGFVVDYIVAETREQLRENNELLRKQNALLWDILQNTKEANETDALDEIGPDKPDDEGGGL